MSEFWSIWPVVKMHVVRRAGGILKKDLVLEPVFKYRIRPLSLSGDRTIRSDVICIYKFSVISKKKKF